MIFESLALFFAERETGAGVLDLLGRVPSGGVTKVCDCRDCLDHPHPPISLPGLRFMLTFSIMKASQSNWERWTVGCGPLLEEFEMTTTETLFLPVATF